MFWPVSEAIEDAMALNKARSLLSILLATCQQTLLALDAVANVLDTDMTEDLRGMIVRTESELEVVTEKLAAFRGGLPLHLRLADGGDAGELRLPDSGV